MKNIAIILAAGTGDRFGDETPKQFLILHGRRVLDYSVKTFSNHADIDDIIIVCHSDWIETVKGEYPKYRVIEGGASRRDSSYSGLLACPDDTDNVLIHDAARPFIDNGIISNCIAALKTHKAVDTVIPADDTIVEVSNDEISNMPVRDKMRLGQTPQCFDYKTILEAHSSFKGETTDDIRLVNQMGIKCKIVDGSIFNFKLTNQPDVYLAERITQIQNYHPGDVPKLSGKKVLIFGGTGGIGSASGELLKKHGAEVTCLGRDDINFLNEDIPRKFYENKYDIIIHSAGLFRKLSFEDSTLKDWDDIFSINLRSCFAVAKLAVQSMNNPGWLVFVGSSSSNRGREDQSIYASSKAGLINFTQSLSIELADKGICVNCINPPRTDTKMRHKEFPNEDKNLLADPKDVACDIVQYCFGSKTGHIVNLKYDKQSFVKRASWYEGIRGKS